MYQILIRNASVIDGTGKPAFSADVAVKDGKIVLNPDPVLGAEEVIDAKGCFCIPSFIDIHLHIESSMVAPATFSRELLRHGVTACVAEPHEIANVMGI